MVVYEKETESNSTIATPLTTAVLESNYYGYGQGPLVNRIIEEISKRYSAQYSEDDFADFLIDFYGRIRRMVTKYEFYGTPFEHYLMSVVRVSFAHHKMLKRQSSRYVQAYEQFSYSLPAVSEQENSSDADVTSVMLRIVSVRNLPITASQSKRLLILSLKFSHWLTGKQVQKIARIVGYTYERLLLLIESVRVRVTERFATQRTIIERRNQLYAQLMRAYCDLQSSGGASMVREGSGVAGNQRLDKMRQRLQMYNHRADRHRLTPTNKMVANMLNMPKGTVDASMFILKRRYRELYTGDFFE